MAVPFSNTKLRVPRGFQNILESLAREVLRSQPDNIFKFGTDYFENLLRVREEGGADPADQGAVLEDRYYNNDSFSNPSVDAGDPEQQAAATTIQNKFRQHSAKKEVEQMKEEDAAVKIQAGFRGFQDRQEVLKMKDPEEYEKRQHELEKRLSGDIRPSSAKDGGPEEEVDIDLGDPDVEKAAVKIQAGFKGYKARKDVQELKESQTELASASNEAETPAQAEAAPEPEKPKEEEEEEMPNLADKDVQNVTAKLQKGFMSRKKKK